MKQCVFKIIENVEIAPCMMKVVLQGDVFDVKKPGQFVNVALPGKFLRRPISVCDVSSEKVGNGANESDVSENGELTLIYKVVGSGTEIFRAMKKGSTLDILTGLGNGYDLSDERIGENVVLIGGGSGIPPLFFLSKKLIALGKKVFIVLGFNKKDEIYFEKEFQEIGSNVFVSTVDGSYGTKGFVTDCIVGFDFEPSYYFACGPEPMLKALYNLFNPKKIFGQMSFETRMGCGFGSCMGCSFKVKGGVKRLCKEGPVLKTEEIILW